MPSLRFASGTTRDLTRPARLGSLTPPRSIDTEVPLGNDAAVQIAHETEAVALDFETRRMGASHGGREQPDTSDQDAEEEDGHRDEEPQVAALGGRDREHVHVNSDESVCIAPSPISYGSPDRAG